MSFAQVYSIEALSHVRPVFNFDGEEEGDENNEFDQQTAQPTSNVTNFSRQPLEPKIAFYVNDQVFQLDENPIVFDLNEKPQYLSKKFCY